MKTLKTLSLFEFLLIYLSICWTVWAQTTNTEPTTQLSGNAEPLTSTETTSQTPETGDQTETTTAIEGNDWVSMTNTSDTPPLVNSTLSSVSPPETTTGANESEVTTGSDEVINADDYRNSSSTTTQTNSSEERQTSDTPTTTESPVPDSSEQTSSETNTELTNSSAQSGVTSEQIPKSPKSLNLSESDDSMSSSVSTSSSLATTNESTTALPLRTSEGLSSTASTSSESITTQNWTLSESSSQTNSETSNANIGEGVRDRFETILHTMQNTVDSSNRSTSETADERPSQSPGVQSTTKIESEFRTSTEAALHYADNDTISERQNTSTSDDHRVSHTQTHQSSSNFTDPLMPTIIYASASDIGNTITPEGIKHSETTTQSAITTLQSQSSTQEKALHTNESNNRSIEISSTTAQSQTSPATTRTPLIHDSTPGFQPSLESIFQSLLNQTQAKPSSDSPPSSSSSEPILVTSTPLHISQSGSPEFQYRTTQSSNESPSMSSRSEASVPVITESVGISVANESEPPIGSQTTNKLPLTDHSFKTTHTRPITTNTPHESNISLIRVVLPNIKYISSPNISKNDLINLVTVTFSANTLDIFRFISVYDPLFRNFTCSLIDTERNWCSIDRFVYLSPSPLIRDNQLILNFFIDDSNDNDLMNYHFFTGSQIVESLKNSTTTLESMMLMKLVSLQTNLGTMVMKPLEPSPERLAKFELLVFVFTVVMFICTVLLCLAIICSCAKRKSVDRNQIQLSNAGRRHTSTNGGFDLNPASNILRDENEDKINHNVINLEGWVAPIDHLDNQKNAKLDSLQDTKL